jgi:hypothetical protein
MRGADRCTATPACLVKRRCARSGQTISEVQGDPTIVPVVLCHDLFFFRHNNVNGSPHVPHHSRCSPVRRIW